MLFPGSNSFRAKVLCQHFQIIVGFVFGTAQGRAFSRRPQANHQGRGSYPPVAGGKKTGFIQAIWGLCKVCWAKKTAPRGSARRRAVGCARVKGRGLGIPSCYQQMPGSAHPVISRAKLRGDSHPVLSNSPGLESSMGHRVELWFVFCAVPVPMARIPQFQMIPNPQQNHFPG